MKLLMIDDRIPLAAYGAGYPRANAVIHALLPACERLVYYPLVFPDESLDAPYAELDPRVGLVMSRGKSGLRDTLVEYAQAHFDVLWVSRPENMQCVDAALATLPDVRRQLTVVYDAEAFYAPRTAQMRALGGMPMSDEAAAQDMQREIALAGRADMLVSVSDTEAELFRTRAGRPTYVLGFTSTPQATSAAYGERADFGFVGGIRPDSPNEDSLLWYAANVMHPLSARTGARLRVAGFIDSKAVLSYAGEELLIHGPLPDLQPFFAHIRVFVAATRFAAGLPQKLIDAASAGVPIVATSILAKALGWRDGVEVLVADDPQTYVAACERLYTDERLWNTLRVNALAAVRARYGPQPFAREVDAIVNALNALRAQRSALAR